MPRLLLVLIPLTALLTCVAHGGELERPVPLVIVAADGERLAGRMVAFDEAGFELQDDEDQTRTVAWTRLDPGRIYQMHRKLLGDDAEAWLALGQRLRDMERGEPASDKALNWAVRLDETLEEQADRIRQGLPPVAPESEASAGDGAVEEPGAEHPGGAHGGEGMVGPRMVGQTQDDYWGELSDELMASSVEELKAFAAETEEKLDLPLRLHETENFLFYSDLSATEAQMWARELEAMYAKLCFMFDLDKSKNIFRGKCLIMVFQKESDYHRFQMEMHKTISHGSAGMCHSFGDGHVHVAFYRQPDKWSFAHVLVHESVHGFVHRYQSPEPIPSWINEGLAETISAALIPKSPSNRYRAELARSMMKRFGNLGGMFDAQHIDAWQYGAARLLTEFMIAQDKKRYANFIQGIKEGLSWRESLEQRYGVSLERLVAGFGASEDIRSLRP